MILETVQGNHPYADEFPMASEDELQELTDSISTVGLIHPVVLTPDGFVLDGRNRMEACRRAGVDPTFETRDGDDDEYKEFVIGVNTTGRRESMSTSVAAAAASLILGHDRRINGQWKRGAVNGPGSVNDDGIAKAMQRAGLVLDVLGPPHLEEVRDGTSLLKHKWEEARVEKDRLENAERRKVEAAQAEEERERYAADYFANHPAAQEWLNSKPEGVFETARSAFAAYQEHDREARAAEEERRREEEQRQREHLDSLKRDANRLKGFLTGYGQAWGMREHPHRDHVLNMLEPTERKRFITIEGEITWPETKH